MVLYIPVGNLCALQRDVVGGRRAIVSSEGGARFLCMVHGRVDGIVQGGGASWVSCPEADFPDDCPTLS